MNPEHLRHILRAAAAVTGEKVFVVVGSQSILGSYPDAPRSLRKSVEGDTTRKIIPRRPLKWMGPSENSRRFTMNLATMPTVLLPKLRHYQMDGNNV